MSATKPPPRADATLTAPPPVDMPGDSLATFNKRRADALAATVVDADSTDSVTVGRRAIASANAGPFELRRVLGQGGNGEVWEAVQVTLGRTVAVKRLRRDILPAGEEGLAYRRALETIFHSEALTHAALDHPNILPIHDMTADADGHPLLAMKLVRGKSWQQLIEAEFATMPADDFLARHLPILVAVGQAVAYAHSRGVIHRDLKPSQVMVGDFGEVLLMDWGLAVQFDREALRQVRITVSDDMIPTLETASSPAGTPAFMAPEQTEGTAEHVGPWTDVYLLGGSLYYILTGKTPHTGETSQAAYFAAAEGIVRTPEEAAPEREIPAELSALAMQAMARDPAKRIESARQFVERLQGYASGATHRREAESLAEEAKASLEGCEARYEALIAIDMKLNRIGQLWPQMPGLAAMQDRFLARFSDVARTKGDHELARIQATRMRPSPERDRLLRRVEEELADEERRECQRRRLKAFLGVAVALLFLTGSFAYLWSVEKHAEELDAVEARLATERAQQAEMRARDAERAARELLRSYRGQHSEVLLPPVVKEYMDAAAAMPQQ